MLNITRQAPRLWILLPRIPHACWALEIAFAAFAGWMQTPGEATEEARLLLVHRLLHHTTPSDGCSLESVDTGLYRVTLSADVCRSPPKQPPTSPTDAIAIMGPASSPVFRRSCRRHLLGAIMNAKLSTLDAMRPVKMVYTKATRSRVECEPKEA
mmetsp:Transcript_40852/g.89378  ORF Transcript_40852/g.89378 Transcript_40852/m.89378 type:complete len:155 (+) Transcript_40852:54-518(+)